MFTYKKYNCDEIVNTKLDDSIPVEEYYQPERTAKLRSVYPGFKCIFEELKDKQLSSEFWVIERENIRKFNEQARKEKDSMKMTFEKLHQEFTI